MTGHDIRECSDIFFNIFDIKPGRYSLEENSRGGLAKWNCGTENDDCDDQRNTRIGVEAPGEVSQPDEESGGDNTNVSQSVTHNVEEDAAHVQIAMRVAVSALARLFWFRVVVRIVHRAVESLISLSVAIVT